MNVAVVLVIDDIGGTQKGITKHGELIIRGDAEDANVVAGLLPDEVVVRDIDLSLAKLEVDRALLVANIARDSVQARVVALRRSSGFGESILDLVEVLGGQSRHGVATVEEHGLAIGLVKDFHLGTVFLGHRDAVEVDPVAGELIGRLGGGDNGTLLEVTRELLGIDTTKDDGTSLALNGTDIKRESTALDETLSSQVVENKRVVTLPALQLRTSTHDTSNGKLTVSSNTKHLLANFGRTNLDIVVTVFELGEASSISNLASRVGIDKCLTAIETTKLFTKGRVGGFAAHRVDPEFGRASVKVDSDGLCRGTDLEFDGVEEARFLGAYTNIVLASKHSVLGRGTGVDFEGVSKHTGFLDHSVVHGELDGLGQKRQSRN